ncbi:MAG: hypothetical protein NC247_15170, partial [Ruminococcus flavefaciens]|nr:hypothetical protein [Ruminococcus flavefaciens]
MSYHIKFKIKPTDSDDLIDVGDEWINHTDATSAMIKDVCGSYPSFWNGQKALELLPLIVNGINLLKENTAKYKQFETDSGWGSIESTIDFLESVRKNCEEYPASVLE